ncbi:Signal peptidase I [Bertholletia excelsa]
MGAPNFLWSVAKKCFTMGLIGVTISDRFASVAPVRGHSMSPTFNPRNSNSMELTDDYVLVEKLCLRKYEFSCGDVIIFCSPNDHKVKFIKRITGLPGDWITIPYAHDVLKVPEGYCWVEGDNSAHSLDSRQFGPVPLGLVQGRVTHIIWPPTRVGKVERKISRDGLAF